MVIRRWVTHVVHIDGSIPHPRRSGVYHPLLEYLVPRWFRRRVAEEQSIALLMFHLHICLLRFTHSSPSPRARASVPYICFDSDPSTMA